MLGNQIFSDPKHPLAAPQCTLISIVPFEITENKPGMVPGHFHIEASKDGQPQCTLIGDSIHYVYIDKDRGSMKVLDPSYQVARSVVYDYLQAQLESAPGCHPGLMWKMGEWTPERVMREIPGELEELRQIQFSWLSKLVEVADDDWEKIRSHHAISDTQRFAARTIDPSNSRQRPWILAKYEEMTEGIDEVETILCPACGSDVPATVVICRFCQCIIDQERYQQLSFAGPKPVGIPDISKFMKPGGIQ